MKLNPTKCAFEVLAVNFFALIVYQRGIKTNLEKVRVLLQMKSLTNMKEVQTFDEKDYIRK